MAARNPSGTTARTTRKKALPKTLWSALGPLKVLFTAEGLDADFGEFDYSTRVIKVKPDLQEAQKRHTLAHEWLHSVFWDAGIPKNVLTHEQEEQLCDVIATALVASNLF